HGGIDYAAKRGTRIFAPADGKILKAGVAGGYGNYVMIKHAFEYKTAYAHLDRVVVEKNQPVKQGELVGYVGNSGSSTGPHLHYEVIRRNKKIDPERVQQN
ncbi:MAG: M23 family metallopeptidase, partial [Nitrospinota bacterium]